jgi:hypothetical protein
MFLQQTKVAELPSAGRKRTSVPAWLVMEMAGSAGELIAGQFQSVEIAQNRHRN